MNTNWSKILLFSLLSFALGFLIARTCCHRGGCGNGGSACHSPRACAHGGGCCTEEGHCDKPGCDHVRGGDCCTPGPGGHHGMHGEHPGDAEAEAIAHGLEAAGFIGDTTIAIPGGEVRVVRSADNMSVHVEKRGPEKTVIEKEIVHEDAEGAEAGK